MRLLSITVHNYRIHRELHVDLDASRTVIGGPNECGKSTLVEATHRALFLKARITGETQKSMRSDFYPGHPEVAVSFEAGGRTYKIQKRFSGTTGTATLTELGGPTWTGDEAETFLAELLGVAASGGKQKPEQWAHLWVWQGEAGRDPTGHANKQQDTLLARLQDSAGAGGAVMQSELDARVAGVFAKANEELFNQNGNPQKKSELGQAMAKVEEAKQKREEAQTKLNRSSDALKDLEEAENIIHTTDQTLPGLKDQRTEVEKKLARVTGLRGKEQTQERDAGTAAVSHSALEKSDQQTRDIRTDIQTRTATLAPKEAETQQLGKFQESCNKRQNDEEKKYDKAINANKEMLQRRDLVAAYVGQFESISLQKQLKEMLEKVQVLRPEKDGFETELARLPLVASSQVEDLRKLEKARDKAEASLAAMAAGIEVVASNIPVNAGDEILKAGRTRVLTEDTEITIGQSITLRIKPGGGTSLTDARGKLQDTNREFQSKLTSLGVESTSDASFACAQRESLEGKVAGANRELDALRADSIEQELSNAGNSVEKATAKISRLGDSLEDFVAPKDEAEARSLLIEVESDLPDSQESEKAAKALRDEAAKNLKDAIRSFGNHHLAIQEERNFLLKLDGQLSLLLEAHGDDLLRSQKLKTLLDAKSNAAGELNGTRRELNELQPDLLELAGKRLNGSIAEFENDKTEAGIKRGIALSQLQRDGTDDPQEDLAIAESRERAANEHLEQAQRNADSIKRLHELFIDEQHALSERFTRPLAEKVSGYLQCLFGAGARAKLNMEDNAFSHLSIARSADSTGAFEFEALSEGTREQVAAAFRLGMAEVLAADYAGCLPVVFDDAFAYSDPQRVQALQGMLYLAADRGLQVMVLSCNPADYAGLGAKQIMLRSEKPSMRRSLIGATYGTTEEMPASEEIEDPPLISTLTPVTEEQRTAFIAALEAEGGGKGNIRLRQILGWDEATYEAVKRDLRAAGRLTLGKGKGGSVSLT